MGPLSGETIQGSCFQMEMPFLEPSSHLSEYPGVEHSYRPLCVSQEAGPSFISACSRNIYLINEYIHWQEFQGGFFSTVQ